MTLMPIEAVRLAYGPEIDERAVLLPEGRFCAVPDCDARYAHRHHIVPRSRTAGPREFVSIDGLIVTNIARLCHAHHEDVTGRIGGHRAWIVWAPSQEFGAAWWWTVRQGDKWVPTGILDLTKGADGSPD